MTVTKGGNVTPLQPKGHRVTLFRDNMLTYPELYLEVFLAAEDIREERLFIEMFAQAKCTRADTPEKADLVVFGGGSDVDPAFYGEVPHATTRVDSKRDQADLELYMKCYKLGIPMFGVCRGAQFLHVMNGGKLFQHIDNHMGEHPIWAVKDNRLINRVSSVHHQCCIYNRNSDMEVLGDSPKASIRWRNPTDFVKGNMKDVEAYFYRSTHCLGVQGHPEYKGYGQFMKWTLDLIQEYISCSPDTEQQGRVRRLKPSFINEREARIKAETEERQKELN